MESRRADDAAIFGIDGDQCSAGVQGFAEKCPENFFLVTILGGMLFPDERIGGCGVKAIKIFGSKGPEFQEFAFQEWLEIYGHENNLVVMYLSPVSARMTTIVFSAFSFLAATARAACAAAPDETPATIPSSRASRRAHANASSSVTAKISSRMERFNT